MRPPGEGRGFAPIPNLIQGRFQHYPFAKGENSQHESQLTRRLVPRKAKNMSVLREILEYDPEKEHPGGVTVKDFFESLLGAREIGGLDD